MIAVRAFACLHALACVAVPLSGAAAESCAAPAKVTAGSVGVSAQFAGTDATRVQFEAAVASLADGRIDKASAQLAALTADPALSPGDRALAQSLQAVASSAGGEIRESVRLASEAVAGARSAGSPRLRAAIATNAALAITEAGDTKAARAALLSAATDAAAAGDRRIEAIALVDLALLESRADGDVPSVATRAAKAIEALTQAAERAPLYASLGLALFAARDGAQADARAAEMLAFSYRDASSVRNARDMAVALGLLGELHGLRGDPRSAVTALERALALSRAAGEDPWRYRWYWRLGLARASQKDAAGAQRDLESAVAELESAKAAGSLGRLAGGTLARNYRGAYLDLVDLLLSPEGDLGQARLKQARDLLERSRTAEIEDYFREPCVTASARRTEQVESIDPKVAVVYPVSFADRTEILVGHVTGFTRYRVAAGAVAVARESQRLRSLIELPGDDRYLRPAARLDEWLVQPIAPQLGKLGVTTIVWVPDGALRGVPFAALHDGKRFLVERYAIGVTPVASLVDPRPLGATSRRAILTGLTEARGGFEALSSVADELNALAVIFDAPVRSNADFTAAALRVALERAPAAVVHVATHGQFAPDNSETFLLTWDGRMTLPQLRQALAGSKLREEPVELLTLSACQTAAGDERAALGLAGVAIASGARSALATLWSVSDESTAILIPDFYRRLLAPGQSKAGALREAQLDLLRHRIFSHPAFWAPFILIGNWM